MSEWQEKHILFQNKGNKNMSRILKEKLELRKATKNEMINHQENFK